MSVKVSVLLPVNRDDGYLDAAVSSILNQTFRDFELLIIANNCTDELWSKIENIKESDIRVKSFRLDLGGLTFALNYGLNIAKGEYIARMDADDISLPQRLEKQVDFLDKNTSVVILGAQISYIDDDGELSLLKASILPKNPSEKVAYYKCPIYHPTVMFRKSIILSIGGYKYGFYGEDFELWLRCIKNNLNIVNLSDILLNYRIHENQVSSTSVEKNIYIYAMLYIFFKKYKDYNFLKGMFFQNKVVQFLILRTHKFRKKMDNWG